MGRVKRALNWGRHDAKLHHPMLNEEILSVERPMCQLLSSRKYQSWSKEIVPSSSELTSVHILTEAAWLHGHLADQMCVENISTSETLNTLSAIHITLICNSPYLSHHKLNLYALLMCTNNLELKRINLECFMNHLLEWHQSHLYCNKYITASDTLYSSQYL